MAQANFRLASAGDDIKLWTCDGFVLDKHFNPHGSSNIASICWSHDNSVLASASTAGDKIVMTYPDQLAFTYSVGETHSVTCLAFNSTSRYVMGGSSTGLVHIWDLKSKSLKKTYQDHKAGISALQFNWNDTVLASGSECGEILLYNVVSGVASSPLVGAKSQAVRCVQYSFFKKSLLGSCSDSGGVYLWDSNKRLLLNSFTSSHLAPATALAFSPLNEMLLMSVGLDKRIVCYDVQGKQAVQTMVAESPLTSVDLMHDGVTLAVGSTRGKIYVYDLRKGAEPLRSLVAHKSSIQGLKFQYKTAGKADGSTSSSKQSSRSRNIPTVTMQNHVTKGKTNGAHVITNKVGGRDSDGNANGERSSMMNTSPAHLQVYESRPQNGEDVFSPIREVTTPKSVHDGSGDRRISEQQQQGKNSSINSFVDGMFSPLASANNSGKSSPGASGSLGFSNLASLRKQPLGGAVGDPYEADDNTEGEEDIDLATERFLAVTHPSRRSPAQVSLYSPHTFSKDDHTSSGYGHSETSPPQRHQPRDLAVSPALDGRPHTMPVSPRSPGGGSRLRRHYAKPASPSLPPSTSSLTASTSHLPASASTATSTAVSLITPPEAAPAGAEGGTILQPFHTEFIRHLVDDALDDFREQVRQDVLNLHMEMLKQFQIQQEEMRLMFEKYSLNGHLLEEVERLREENSRLKKTF